MKTRATNEGLLIPKEFLGGHEEFDIVQEENQIRIVPIQTEDSILGLGSNPVDVGETDVSVRHDDYLIQPANPN
jgi:hypothetical protein